MARHLRVVRDEPEGTTYVVARSHLASPGAPFVLARCADRSVAEVFALAGQEMHSREEMEREPVLRAALEAFEADDHALYEQERSARASFKNGDRTAMRMVGRHPSTLGKSS